MYTACNYILFVVGFLFAAQINCVVAQNQTTGLKTSETLPDRGCTTAQVFNSTTGKCQCIEGYDIITCSGRAQQGQCGAYNCAHLFLRLNNLILLTQIYDSRASRASMKSIPALSKLRSMLS